MSEPASPPTRRAAAVLVTALSIALAEVSIGSQPWGLLNPLLWVVLVPVYGAQVLALAALVLRRNARPTLTAVWAAGFVMGLYEFYITGVLWDQPWDGVVSHGLVEVPELIVLAGFYHPFVSFILPLALAEQVVAREPRLWGLMPGWLRRWGPGPVWVASVTLGATAGAFNAPHGPLTALSLSLTAVALWGLVTWARRAPAVDSLADALPRGRWLVGTWVVTGAFFAVFVVQAQRGPDPVGLARQGATWALYAVAAVLLVRNLRHTRVGDVARVPRSARWWAEHVGVAVLVAGVVAVLPGTEVVALVVVWGGGAVIALTMAALAVAGAVQRPRVVHQPERAAVGAG